MIQRFQLACRGGRLCPPARNTTAGWSFAANSYAPSALTVGADAHIGPGGSYEFAEDFRKNGALCRADVGIGPYKRVGKRIRIRLGFPEKATASSEPTESSAPTDAVYLLRFMKIGF